MRLLWDIGKAIWYMAKAGLRRGAIQGGLFGLALLILPTVTNPGTWNDAFTFRECV